MFSMFAEMLCSVILYFENGQCGLVMRWETFCFSSNQDHNGVIKGCFCLIADYIS